MNSLTPPILFIGVDGGGTHTRAIAMDTNGNTLGAGISEGSNPNNIGFHKAAEHILDAIAETRATLDEHTSICMGIAGLATNEQRDTLARQLTSSLPDLKKGRLHLTHDLEIAHYAAFQGQPGIVLIAGTGSACFAINPKRETFRASGRDFRYEDPGSGYAIGKRAIDTKLLPSTDTRQATAALAPRVIELATDGDLKALDILRIEAENIAKLASLPYLDFKKSEPFPTLALAGSILTTESLYRYSVLFELQSALPGIQIIDTKTSPELAAIELAKHYT